MPEAVWPVSRYATAGVFEETLLCDTRMTQALKQLPQKFAPKVLAAWQEDV